MPAFYRKVLAETSAEAVTLMAHSQGGTQSFAALSGSEELQSKTRRFIALSPVLYMNRFTENPNIFTYLAKFQLVKIARRLKIWALDKVNTGKSAIPNFLIRAFCVYTSFVCKLILSHTVERFPEVIDLESLPELMSVNPSGSSVKSYEHFTQLIFEDGPRFQKFDYGREGNLEKYNAELPPEYDISRIKTKVALFYGEGDNLCTLENVAFINNKKKDILNYYLDLWGHVAYGWGKDKGKFYEKLSKALTL